MLVVLELTQIPAGCNIEESLSFTTGTHVIIIISISTKLLHAIITVFFVSSYYLFNSHLNVSCL